jgi:nucleoside-diphosphate-sugar epimerase
MARVVVLGAAGFLGSHLCDRLTDRGDEVVGVDDLSSGSIDNIAHLKQLPSFQFVEADICGEWTVAGKVDSVLNFASLASPPRYFANQLHTLRTGSLGTDNALRLSVEKKARFIMASTSEVYGDPEVHPQVETYRGSVNPIGPRSCYDEAKRYAEALCMAYRSELNADIGIVRIFNTYGPRLDRKDGRVVSNFIDQALTGEPLTVYGDGTQTRSFCYVDDEVDGIIRLLDSREMGPINIGNPGEFTMLELAQLVIELTRTRSTLEFHPLPQDDPLQRCPDISKARAFLGWEPKVDLREGLLRTIDWFRSSQSHRT